MAIEGKARPQRTTVSMDSGISLSALEDRLGSQAAQEFLSRIDRSQRHGTTIIGTSVRDARTGISKAKLAGHVQVVVPGRSGNKPMSKIGLSDSLVIIKLDDLAAVVRAGRRRRVRSGEHCRETFDGCGDG